MAGFDMSCCHLCLEWVLEAWALWFPSHTKGIVQGIVLVTLKVSFWVQIGYTAPHSNSQAHTHTPTHAHAHVLDPYHRNDGRLEWVLVKSSVDMGNGWLSCAVMRTRTSRVWAAKINARYVINARHAHFTGVHAKAHPGQGDTASRRAQWD